MPRDVIHCGSLVSLLICLAATTVAVQAATPAKSVVSPTAGATAGDAKLGTKLSIARITAGPFDLHRRYRSMQGPFVRLRFRVSDLVLSKDVSIPENKIQFVEDGNNASMSSASVQPGSQSKEADCGRPQGLIDTSSVPRALYWFKGIKLQVLDENNQPLPTAEFICHMNVDVVPEIRNRLFPQSERCVTSRVITLTQGQTELNFPEGFAVPVASDEVWSIAFQAANRTTDQHRRIKHLCTLTFVKDTDVPAGKPLKALHWFNPYIAVALDPNADTAGSSEEHAAHGPDCLIPSSGDPAPNMVPGSTLMDSEGRAVTGHWTVPEGSHVYEGPVTEQFSPGFAAEDRRIQAVWSHVHPLCTQFSMLTCDGNERKPVFSIGIKTKTKGGLQIEHMDSISSTEGIPLHAGARCVLEAAYNNQTGIAQDAMASLGVFCADTKFVKPDWRSSTDSACSAPVDMPSGGKDGLYCGIRNSNNALASPTGSEPH